MRPISNLTIQVMTFDETLFSGELFTSLACILNPNVSPRLVWSNQMGARKSLSMRRLNACLMNMAAEGTGPAASKTLEVNSRASAGCSLVFK